MNSKKPILKPKQDNYAIIQTSIDYNSSLLLPYEDAIKLMDSLVKAEIYVDHYDNDPEIKPIKKGNNVSMRLLSTEEYRSIKMSQLLKGNIGDEDKSYKD